MNNSDCRIGSFSDKKIFGTSSTHFLAIANLDLGAQTLCLRLGVNALFGQCPFN
ncbi:MAG: hypothetical protein V7K68_24895 [Nostoc sp.]|uniref:hypothetical protein n=1 Tax=Nostoc sp. TaxID=1180 RepID=UPI002FF5728F